MARRLALFPTCVVDTVAADVGVAAYRVLRRLGYEPDVPKAATCCGQPAWNAGFADEAATVARTTLAALEQGDDDICVPAGSCATMIRVFWPELFEVVGDHDARDRAIALAGRVKEFSELVASHRDELEGTLKATVAYHHSCHMLRELGIEEAPNSVLESLDGCGIAEWSAAQRCCGFGGLFSVRQPETSIAMADDKLDALADTDAEMLVGCDQSCLMHLEGRMVRRGQTVPVRHLAQVLDEAMPG